MGIIVICVVLIILIIAYLFHKNNNKVNTEQMKQLKSICHGDEDRMQRLINLEKKRGLNISKNESVKRAIESYKRDQ